MSDKQQSDISFIKKFKFEYTDGIDTTYYYSNYQILVYKILYQKLMDI